MRTRRPRHAPLSWLAAWGCVGCAAAAVCDECASHERCDEWQPQWPSGVVDSIACDLCLNDTEACLGRVPPDEWCAAPFAITHCPLTCCRRGHLPRPEPSPGAPLFRFVFEEAKAAIKVRHTEGTQDNLFGFEGGRAMKQGGVYYYFAAEMFGFPVDANMRIALWKAPDIAGPWTRISTIQSSNQTYKQVSFQQQCNQPYCKWQNATADRFRMLVEYQCDTSDLLGSPWAPFPLFDRAEDRWHVLYVSYICDGTWMVAAGAGNIFGARSATKGIEGIEGPYETYGIVIGPNASDTAKRWGSGDHQSPMYVDAIDPFVLANGTYAAFVGEDHYLATAASAAGPWSVHDAHSPAVSTPSSTYNENPVVTRFTRPGGEQIFVAVFDTVQSEHLGFGMTWSEDGIHWRPGVDVPLPGGCRTPLGLIDEGGGRASLLFTRRFADCANQTGLPGNGADAISPASCANVYAATFSVDWQPSGAAAGPAIGPASRQSGSVADRLLRERELSLIDRLAALDKERDELAAQIRELAALRQRLGDEGGAVRDAPLWL